MGLLSLGNGRDHDPASEGGLAAPLVPFARTYRLDAGESPVRFQQPKLNPKEQLPAQLDFVAYGPVRDPLITFSLDTRALPQDLKDEIRNLLAPGRLSSSSDFELLQRLRFATDHIDPDPWHSSAGSQQPSVAQPTNRMNLTVPKLNEYVDNPFRLGREYWTEMSLEGTVIRLDAIIRPETNTTDFTISRPEERPFETLEVHQVTGSLRRGSPLTGTVADLRTLVWRAMETFWDKGRIGLREFVTLANWRSAPVAKLASGAAIKLRLGAKTSSITLSSGEYTRESTESRGTTWCRWRLSTGTPQEELHIDLARTADRLQTEHKHDELESVLRSLQLHENFEQFEAHPAAIESVFGPELAATLTTIPELTLTPQAPRTPQQLAAVLRGFNRAVISLPAKTTIQAPQLFNTMEVAIAPSGAVMLAIQNGVNNRLEAQLSSHSRFDPNSREDVVETLAKLLAAQVESPAPSTERCAILKTLHVARDRDVRHNRVEQVGDAVLPHFLDAESHRVIDQTIAPLMKLFRRLRRSEHGTSHVVSPRPGCVRLELVEPHYRFQLTMEFSDGRLTGVSVTPRTGVHPFDSTHSKPSAYTYDCNIPLVGAESDGSTVNKLVRLTTWFFDLSRPREQQVQFEGSYLQAYLDEIAQPLWREANK